jgi:hypothetical protein
MESFICIYFNILGQVLGAVQSGYYYHLVIQLKFFSFGVKQQLLTNPNDVSEQEGQSIPNIGEKKLRNRDVRAVYPYKIF